MPRYICTEDGASKFWEITVDGASVTVRYGKLGTAGQSKTKTHASAAAAEAEASKLVREKTGKGYVEAPEGESTGGAAAAAPAATDPAPAATDPAPAKKAAVKKDRKDKAAATGTAVPPFGDLEAKALRSLATKLAKNPRIDSYKVSKLVRDANGDDYSTVRPILWHLVEHGLLAAEGLKGVLQELNDAPDGGKPEVVFALFSRMGPHLAAINPDGWTEYTPGVPSFLDRLLVRAWERDSALFEERKDELDPRLQLALAFVRRRFEREIDPADAERILDHLANRLANGDMTGNTEIWMSKGGERVEHHLNGEEALLELAERFGAREDFCRRVVKHALGAGEPGVRYLRETLNAASIGDVAEIFARCYSWGDSSRCEQELAYLESRDDSPEALFAAAEELVPGKTRGKYESQDDEEPARHRLTQRDDLLALGAVRFAAANKPVPERFEELYRWSALSDVYYPTIPRHLAAFRALPRERALAFADGLIGHDYQYAPAVVVLAAHRDDERLQRVLVKDRANGYVGPRYWGLHGAALIPRLEEEMAHLANDKQARRNAAILCCLATAAREGAAVDPAWTKHLRWDTNGPEPLKYWSTTTDGALRDDALDAFPPEQRRQVLLRAATEEPHPTRVLTSRHAAAEDRELLVAIVDQMVKREGAHSNYDQINAIQQRLGAVFADALCDTIGRLGADAAFLDLLRGPLPHLDHQRVLASMKGKPETLRELFAREAAAAPGPKQRVYTLDRDGEDGFAAKEGSFSRIGGSVPGLPEEAYPKLGGEPLTPVLTLDLDEIPELGARYPDARLLVLFDPDPEGGEEHESACLVPVPRSAVSAPGDGAALAVTPFDLPEALFEGSDERGREVPAELSGLRRQLLKRGGHVLGGPFWIQEACGGNAGFLFELRDGLCDLNLGDVGSLYAYEGDELIFQCH